MTREPPPRPKVGISGKRVALLQLWQETNTFNRFPTDEAHFLYRLTAYGDEMLAIRNVESEVSGYLEVLEELGAVPVPVASAVAPPGGPVDEAFYREFRDEVRARLEAVKDGLDAVLVSLHGALEVGGFPDAQGDLLQMVRRVVGDRLPIVVTFDFHANISDRLLANYDGATAYQTHPHVDIEETGRRGARLLARWFAEPQPWHVELVRVPALLGPLNIRTDEGPMAELIALARETERQPGVLAASMLMGFPNADTPYTCAAAMVTATDQATARTNAEALATEIWSRRDLFNPRLPTAAERVAEVMANPVEGLTLLQEMCDGVSQGGAQDGPLVLSEMLRAGMTETAYGPLVDQAAAEAAAAVGVGGRLNVELGGKIDVDNFQPLPVNATVVSVTDGKWVGKGAVGRGTNYDMGTTAVLRVDGVDVVVTSNRVSAYDPELFRHAGIDPEKKRYVCVKQGALARAAYAPITARFAPFVSPGWGTVDYSLLRFEHLTRPIYPLDPQVEFDPTAGREAAKTM